MIEHKSRQNKKRKCLKIDNLLKKNRIEGLGKSDLSSDYSPYMKTKQDYNQAIIGQTARR